MGLVFLASTLLPLTIMQKPASAAQNYCNSSPYWWVWSDCVLYGYNGLKSITVNDGSGADIGFRPSNGSYNTVWKHANKGQTVYNPVGSTTDLYIHVDNDNWFTGFWTGF
jgi:hypothetical protein